MAKLLDWLPFRFRKGHKDEAPVPVHRADTPAKGASVPATTPAWPSQPSMGGLAPWFSQPTTLFQQMDELMNRLWSQGPGGDMLRGFFGDFSTPFSPTLDVFEDDASLKVVAEVPGLGPDDLHVEVQEGLLTLSGEKRLESEHREDGFYRSERAFGQFRRVVPLPSNLDLDRVEAKQRDGVLTVRIPKLEEEAPASRRVPVSKG